MRDEAVASGLDDLGERDVVAAGELGSGVHRGAEAGAARLTALDRDDEQRIGGRALVRVRVRPAEQDPVEHRARVQLT